MVWRCKDIKLSGTQQDEQVGVLIIKLKGSTIAKLGNHDLMTTAAQNSLNLKYSLVPCRPLSVFSLNLYYFTSHCVQ